MVAVLEGMAKMLTPQQLSFLKTPGGHLQFDHVVLDAAEETEGRKCGARLKKRPYRQREDFDASLNARRNSHRSHRKTEQELLSVAKRMALPTLADHAPVHHYGMRD